MFHIHCYLAKLLLPGPITLLKKRKKVLFWSLVAIVYSYNPFNWQLWYNMYVERKRIEVILTIFMESNRMVLGKEILIFYKV